MQCVSLASGKRCVVWKGGTAGRTPHHTPTPTHSAPASEWQFWAEARMKISPICSAIQFSWGESLHRHTGRTLKPCRRWSAKKTRREEVLSKSSLTKPPSNYSQTGLEPSPIRPREQITDRSSLSELQDAARFFLNGARGEISRPTFHINQQGGRAQWLWSCPALALARCSNWFLAGCNIQVFLSGKEPLGDK